MVGQSEVVKILFLAASPSGTERRSLDKEIRRIELALERSKRREKFKIIQKWAVTDDDLRRAMLDNEPEFVHFSGQGGGSQGLAFVDSQGRLLVISGDSLARLFELCADHVRCVILNACFSEVQAKVISRHIEIVVGMSQDIGDEASIKFSEGFYDALGAGRSAEKAFEFGRSAIDLRSLQEHLVPIILRNPEIRRLTRAFAQGDGPRRIVPRGLRSFQTEDSDFFLELLPGPRGPDGLPTSLRFWKTRIEERNPDRTFPVGLIYGPSGCGKSSLVKAGLLPRLSDTIQPVLVEATPDDTETRLLKGLRGAFPGLKGDLSLIDTFITLRRETEATGRKTLIVIDQFEQWLHAKTEEEKSDLVLALRLCDGANIQCIVMIRDDFWLGTNRLMKEIGVRISEGENAALVDLFDVRHARKVLGLFADAYGVWENSPVEPTERAQFLDDAVSGLAQDDRVICVRIALFCELFQGKPWDLKTLEKAGGVEGVGVLFMEETFSADKAPAENRYHQKAVRSVLNALLPEPGSKIKGRMRSDRELMDVSGYADRPDDFQALVRILDEKTHLITPTDPEGLGADEGGVKERSVGRFFQLTHDYLVPSIREWLTRKQRETRRGRAELRLAERSEIWTAKSENRQLPSVWEWSNIRLLTKSKDWTEPQRMMMRRAGRVHGLRGLGLAVLIALVSWGGMEGYGRLRASDLVESLQRVGTPDVPAIVKQLSGCRRWADPQLVRVAQGTEAQSREHLHASLALLPVDPSQVDYLFNRLIKATPSELPVLRDALKTHQSTLTPKLWTVLDTAKPGDVSLLPAASALAIYDPDNTKWEAEGGKVAQALVSVNTVFLGSWLDALRPMSGKLNAPLATIFRDTNLSESDREQATDILTDYASDDPDLLADLLLDSEEKSFAVLFDKLKARQERAVAVLEAELARKPAPDATADAQDHLAQRQARAAVALVSLGQGEKVWDLLRHSPDPSVRSYIVNWLKPLGAGPEALMTKLEGLAHDPVSIPKDGKSRMDAIVFHRETSERRALILALGRYNLDELSPDKREPLVEHLREMYRHDPDAGIHGAAEWTLRQWKQQEKLKELDAELSKLKDRGERRWYVNGQGQTFAVIEGPVEFLMGSPPTDTERIAESEPARRMAIPRRFAIAAQEVTVEQFQRFLKLGGITIESYQLSASLLSKFSPDPKGPWIAPDWYTAAHYCNWLSEQEGLPKEQWCYLPNEAGVYAEGMSIPADVLQRTGYRLPTEAEWEYACRAGTVTSRYYGHSLDLLYAYAWYQANSKEHTWTCGSLFPNDLGLFDMLGNTYEWCQDSSNASQPAKEGIYNDIINISESIIEKNPRVLRGGAFLYRPAYVRSAVRGRNTPSYRFINNGFRPSRTYH